MKAFKVLNFTLKVYLQYCSSCAMYMCVSIQEGQLFPPSVAHSPHSAHGKLAANEAKR